MRRFTVVKTLHQRCCRADKLGMRDALEYDAEAASKLRDFGGDDDVFVSDYVPRSGATRSLDGTGYDKVSQMKEKLLWRNTAGKTRPIRYFTRLLLWFNHEPDDHDA